MDTIYAMSSGMPPAAISVVRLTGQDAFAIGEALAGSLPEARRAGLRVLRHPQTRDILDRALVLLFPGPDTATGEDLVELHLHGGRAVVRAVLAALAMDPRTREAEAGEFTRRALMNGRIDLTEAEGLGDLLAAETEAQRRAAIGASEGLLRRNIEAWQTTLLSVAAQVEALLDFADEDDVTNAEELAVARIHDALATLIEPIALLVQQPTTDRLRDGFRIVLAGPPNSGKSTLINRMAGRDVSIVSPIAGTTRDRIEVPVGYAGMPFILIDTAGLSDDTTDTIEAIGVDRARSAIAQADVVLWLGDEKTAWSERLILIHPRADAAGRDEIPEGRIGVSALSGAGVDIVWREIVNRVQALVPGTSLGLNDRQHGLLAETCDALRCAQSSSDLIVMGEELRAARSRFDRLTGSSDVEAMLDTLFGRFCIGK